MQTRVAILGGGPAGLACAGRLAQLDVPAVVIDIGKAGSSVPVDRLAEAMYRFLVASPGCTPDSVVAARDRIVKVLATEARLPEGVTCVRGRGTIEGRGRIRVDGPDDKVTIEADAVVVATGATPEERDGFLSPSQALRLRTLPERITLTGPGVPATEAATLLALAGCHVTWLGGPDLPFEGDVAGLVFSGLRRLGVDLRTAGEPAAGTTRVHCGLPRPGALPRGLQGLGLEPDPTGALPVDDRMRTRVPWILAVGGVVAPEIRTPAAREQGRIAADVLAGLPSRVDPVPAVSSCLAIPEVAFAGISAARARDLGLRIAVGSADAGDQRFARVVLEAGTGRPLGAVLTGPGARAGLEGWMRTGGNPAAEPLASAVLSVRAP